MIKIARVDPFFYDLDNKIANQYLNDSNDYLDLDDYN